MSVATFRFYDELNDFLPRRRRHIEIERAFSWRASVKDMIESMGVPHTELDLIVVNDRSVDFTYIVRDGDRIEAFPRFDDVNHAEKVRLRPPLEPVDTRFILDTHLGRLAAYLRMMGFDTLYRNDYPDDELAQVSFDEHRVLLTRDVGLLKRGIVVYGYFVRELKPKKRLIEIMQRYRLAEAITPFKYCMKCNGELHTVEKDAVISEVPAGTIDYYDEFHQCDSCLQVYWKGPHYDRMLALIDEVMKPHTDSP